MSKETWLAEYYPYKPDKNMTDNEAVIHSLRKWIGAKPKNLEKHGLEDIPMVFSADDCALCAKYAVSYGIRHCNLCPLAVYGLRCSHDTVRNISPWHAYARSGHIEPMIEALTELVLHVNESKNKDVESPVITGPKMEEDKLRALGYEMTNEFRKPNAYEYYVTDSATSVLLCGNTPPYNTRDYKRWIVTPVKKVENKPRIPDDTVLIASHVKLTGECREPRVGDLYVCDNGAYVFSCGINEQINNNSHFGTRRWIVTYDPPKMDAEALQKEGYVATGECRPPISGEYFVMDNGKHVRNSADGYCPNANRWIVKSLKKEPTYVPYPEGYDLLSLKGPAIWIKQINTNTPYLILTVNATGVITISGYIPWATLLKDYKYLDGRVCGVLNNY